MPRLCDLIVVRDKQEQGRQQDEHPLHGRHRAAPQHGDQPDRGKDQRRERLFEEDRHQVVAPEMSPKLSGHVGEVGRVVIGIDLKEPLDVEERIPRKEIQSVNHRRGDCCQGNHAVETPDDSLASFFGGIRVDHR